MKRIGVVLTTYQRFSRFKECFEHLIANSRDVEEIVIVDDCSKLDRDKYDKYFETILPSNIHVFVNTENFGVGISKNRGIKYFYDKGYDYIFTLEDDINVVNPNVFIKYIEMSEQTGFQYINFALHGPLNKGHKQVFNINGLEVAIYPHIVGAFSLHTKKLIDEIGFYDEKFVNAWEHVDYCYQAAKKELTTPFWMFVDLINSDSYLFEQNFSIDDSSIRTRPDWADNIGKGAVYFHKKNGVSISDIPRQ